MALWLLLLHAAGLDRRLLHTHDQENAEEHWEYVERPHQAGYYTFFWYIFKYIFSVTSTVKLIIFPF